MSPGTEPTRHSLGEFLTDPAPNRLEPPGAPVTPKRAENRKSRSRGGEVVSWAFTLLLLGAAVALIKWSGLSLNIVATDSMTPTYRPTDIVVMVSPERVAPAVGKVAVFETEYLGVHIPPHVHRIVERTPDQTWRTQGDNNEQPDPWEVSDAGIRGIVVAGFPSWWIRSPLVIGVVIFLVLVIGFWPRGDDEDADDTADAAASGGVHVPN